MQQQKVGFIDILALNMHKEEIKQLFSNDKPEGVKEELVSSRVKLHQRVISKKECKY